MSVLLVEACERLDDRKRAIFDGEVATIAGDEIRRLMVGFELDLAEVQALADRAAEIAIDGVMRQGASAEEVCRGAWVDGLLTGLMLAELRARQTSETSS